MTTKILDLVIKLIKDTSANWKEELEEINIYDDVKELYSQRWTNDFANKVLAFIVLSYDNQSGWLSLHKDRWDDKRNIATKLGLSTKEKKVKDIIENNNQTTVNVTAWFIIYQADWRWETVISCFEYHSEMMRFARTKSQEQTVSIEEVEPKEGEDGKKNMIMSEVDVDKLAQGNIKKGGNIKQAIEIRQQGEEMLLQMREDYSQLDTVLVKEGRRKMTDVSDIMSWEKYIEGLRKKRGE